MHRQRHHRLGLLPVTMAACCGFAAMLPARGDVVPARLARLAESGQFNDLLVHLRGEMPGVDQAVLGNLITDIERYQTHSDRRNQRRLDDYEQALAKIDEFLNQGRFEVKPDPAGMNIIEEKRLEFAADDIQAPYTTVRGLDYGHCRLSFGYPEAGDLQSV